MKRAKVRVQSDECRGMITFKGGVLKGNHTSALITLHSDIRNLTSDLNLKRALLRQYSLKRAVYLLPQKRDIRHHGFLSVVQTHDVGFLSA